MTVQEFYDSIGGSYAFAKQRLMNEDLMKTVLSMFLDDVNYINLMKCMEEEDYEVAFRAAHNLKSVSANIALAELEAVSIEITDALRNGDDIPKAKELLPKVTEKYQTVIDAIQQLEF